MKKTIALAIAMVLMLSVFCASAEEEAAKVHAILLRNAIGMTAQMVSGAAEGTFDGRQAYWADRLADTAYASPIKAVIADLSPGQSEIIAAALGTDIGGTIRTLGLTINQEYSADYAAVADALYREEFVSSSLQPNMLVLLVYETDLSLFCIQPDLNCQSVFLIGDATVPSQIDEAYVRDFAASVGVTDIAFTIYSSNEEIKAVLSENQSLTSTEWIKLKAVVLSSAASFERMLPEVFRSGIFSIDGSGQSLAAGYLRANADTLQSELAAAQVIAEKINPIVSAYYDESSVGRRWIFYNSTVSDPGCGVADLLPAFSGEAAAEAYDPAGTVLAVWEYQKGTADRQIIFLSMLESTFPAAKIPDSMEAANYILLVTTRWEDVYQVVNGVTLYNTKSAIALYDAKTGSFVTELGTIVTHPKGFITTFGDTYYTPVRGDDVRDLIQEALDF